MQHDPYTCTQGHHDDETSQAERPQHDQTVRTALGIVVVTQEQELIDRRANPVPSRFHQTQPRMRWGCRLASF
jgi:hypothetical protein